MLEALKDMKFALLVGTVYGMAGLLLPQMQVSQRHGRWSNESAKDGYIKDSLSSRLSVSAALGNNFFS